jgi:hypothetical protein
MSFLIRMAFWFSLVLLVLPLDPATGNGQVETISPVQAFFAARAAVDDVAGICERKPDVCAAGKVAMHTIGVRAREGARIAFEMLDDSSAARDSVAGVIDQTAKALDSEATGSVPALAD